MGWGGVNAPIAVSASSICSNCTIPIPLLRLPSYKISACCTCPVVSNSSTRSSLAVDQGNCGMEPPSAHPHHYRSHTKWGKRGKETYVCNQDLLHGHDLAVGPAAEPVARAGAVRARVVAVQIARAPSPAPTTTATTTTTAAAAAAAAAPASEAAAEAATTAEGGPAGKAAPA